MTNKTCGFSGLGLIGGSIAKALKKHCEKIKIIAYDPSPEALRLAKEEGIADIVTDCIDDTFQPCDYIFLCAPVAINVRNLKLVKQIMSSDCILTDVGSVKTDIHLAVEKEGLSKSFIGGHPMAGSERIGLVNAKAVLLENAYYILTPTDEVPAKKVEEFRDLVTCLGAIPLILPYQKHDYVTAAISHLPHLIASSLVNLIKDSDSRDGIMKMVAAGGFKDITRIASSSPTMWQQICLANTDNILELLDRYIQSLTRIKEELKQKDNDALYSLFDSARIYRDSFINASSGPIKSTNSMLLDIDDRSGALVSVLNALASERISIKNIGITHNRESADGVVQIEFYDEGSLKKAQTLFTTKSPKLPPNVSNNTSGKQP